MEDLSRRAFLSFMGSMAATAIVGCGSGDESLTIDGGTHPYGDGGINPGMEAGTDAAIPGAYSLQLNYAQLPCHYPADLDAYTGKILAVATTGGSMAGDYNHLAQIDPASASRPIPSTTFLDLTPVAGRSINKFSQISPSRGIITANDGIYEVSLAGVGTPSFTAFPSGTSYATAALRIGNKLFVTTSNLIGTSYGAGAILVYDTAAAGSILDPMARRITTSRKNPTGFAQRDANTLVVLNSGDYSATSAASIDLIDPASETILRTITLGTLTAQNADRIALTADGKTAIVGTADGSGRLLFVDLDTGTVTYQTISGTQFHSSVKTGNGRIFVTDFNSGILTIFDLASRAIQQSLSLMTNEAGPSELLGNDLVQAIPYGAILVHAG